MNLQHGGVVLCSGHRRHFTSCIAATAFEMPKFNISVYHDELLGFLQLRVSKHLCKN